MLDTPRMAARTRPLASAAVAPSLPGGMGVRMLAPAARFSLRVKNTPHAPVAVGAFRLDQPINRISREGNNWAARLGPDEWLIGGAETDIDAIQDEIEASLSNNAHALVDVSHRNVAFEITGPKADAALNAGCPLDLHERAFPAGSATRTLLGKSEIVLIRPGSAPLFQVECWRSFAPYVHGFLVEATHGLGLL